MSKKKHKKNHKKNHKHANQRKVLTKNPTGFAFGEVYPDLLEYMMLHPDCFLEHKQIGDEWVTIPCSENTFPIAGNLFYVQLVHRGDKAAEIVTDFSLFLSSAYKVREFFFRGQHMMIFAVDAPAEDVKLIWENVLQLYSKGVLK